MLDKAQEINRHGPYGDARFFTKGWSIPDYNQLHQHLDDYIAAGGQTQIIFNFCYFLASKTLDIRDLSDCLTQVVEKYNRHKMFVIYQNPPIPHGYSLQSSYLHRNWYVLKTQLSAFHSQITQSNTERFRYGSLIDGLPDSRKLYFDILSNESSTFSNNPFESSTIF